MNKRMSFLKTLLQLNTNVDWIILRTASLPRLSFSLLSTIDTILLEDFADVFWKLWIRMEKSRLQHIVFVNCLCVRFDRFWPELFGWSFHTKSWKIWNYVDPLKTHDILYKQWHSNGQVPPSLQHDMDLMPPTSWRHCSKATSRRWRACCPGILKELEKLCSWGGIMLHRATSTLHRMCNLQDVMRLARFLYQIQSVEKCSNVKKESLWLDRISQLTSLSTWDSENNTGLFTIFFTCFPNEQV